MTSRELWVGITTVLKDRAGASLLPLERPFDNQVDLVLRLPKDKAAWSVLCYALLRFQEQTRAKCPWLKVRAYHSEYRLKEGKLAIAGIISVHVDDPKQLDDAFRVLHSWLGQVPRVKRPPLTRIDLGVDMRIFSVNKDGKGYHQGSGYHPAAMIEQLSAERRNNKK